MSPPAPSCGRPVIGLPVIPHPACLQAVREGNLSFGFSAGGCLFPYYIGCAGALIDGGVLTGGGAGSRQGGRRHCGSPGWLRGAAFQLPLLL